MSAAGSAPPLLFVTSEFPNMLGGVGDYTLLLGSSLARTGRRVLVFTTRNEKVRTRAGLDVRAVVRSWGPLGLISLFLRTPGRDAGWVLFQYGPYMYSRYGLPVHVPLYFLLVRALTRQRMLLVAHELFIHAGTGRHKLIGFVQRKVFGALARLSEAIVVTTEGRRRLLEHVGVPGSKLHLVRVGSNLDAASAVERRRNGNDGLFRVVVFGSLDLQRRRLDLVHEAVRRLGAKANGYVIELVLVGPKSRTPLPEALLRDGIGHRVKLTGAVPAAEAGHIIATSHASVFFDTHGRQGISSRSTVCAAALSLGTPLVGNRGADTDAIYRDRENVLFCELTAEDLEAKLDELARDDELWKRISDGGRLLFEKELSWEAITTAFLGICGGAAMKANASERCEPPG